MSEKTEIAAPVSGYQDHLTDVAPVKRGRGAPSLYTQELAGSICDLMVRGNLLGEACDQIGVSRSAVFSWLNKHEDFAESYARARNICFDVMAEDTIRIADQTTPLNANADKLRVDTRKWLLSKLKPHVYGDQLAITGADGGPVQIAAVDDRELARRVALLLSQVSELPVIDGAAEEDGSAEV